VQCFQDLVSRFGNFINLLHVVPAKGWADGGGVAKGLMAGMSAGSRQELTKLIQAFWQEGIAAKISVREGRPHEAIIREAIESNASVIILAIRRRSWLSGLLELNTVLRVVQSVPCPALVLPPDKAESAASAPSQRLARLFGL